MTYPSPVVRSLRGGDICDLEANKLAFTQLLQSINEANSHRQSSDDDGVSHAYVDYELRGPLPIPLLWKQGSPCTVSTHAHTLVWDFVEFKQAVFFVDSCIPPAPDAVKHFIRDMPSACRRQRRWRIPFWRGRLRP